MEKSRLLILADDLSGALDSGVQFAKKGIRTRVLLAPETPAPLKDNVSVLVINTNSRHASPAAAANLVKAALKAHKDSLYFYKKTDSCLRGNIGAELEAFMEAAGSLSLAFIPAYPDLKRTTLKGVQYLEGKPIHESSMALDPLNPITESFIPAIIKRQSTIPVRLIPVNGEFQTPGNSSEISREIAREILVFDAGKKEDLGNIARILKERELLLTCAGCAGFAEALAETLPRDMPHDVKNESKDDISIQSLPVLFVSASLHPVSIGQVKAAVKKGIPAFSLTENEISECSSPVLKKAEALAALCGRALLENNVCVLGTEAAFGKGEVLIQNDALTQTIPVVLGKLAKMVIKKAGPLHLVVFGGDSLLGISRVLNYTCIRPIKEIQSGIVLAQAEGKNDGGFLVTKAGSFGDENLVPDISNFLSSTHSL